MNPFEFLAAELAADKPRADYAVALSYLLPLWGEIWASNPEAYKNGYSVIAAKISALADSELKERMLRFVTDLSQKRQPPAYGPTY